MMVIMSWFPSMSVGCLVKMLRCWSGSVRFQCVRFKCRASPYWFGRHLSWWRGCRVFLLNVCFSPQS